MIQIAVNNWGQNTPVLPPLPDYTKSPTVRFDATISNSQAKAISEARVASRCGRYPIQIFGEIMPLFAMSQGLESRGCGRVLGIVELTSVRQ